MGNYSGKRADKAVNTRLSLTPPKLIVDSLCVYVCVSQYFIVEDLGRDLLYRDWLHFGALAPINVSGSIAKQQGRRNPLFQIRLTPATGALLYCFALACLVINFTPASHYLRAEGEGTRSLKELSDYARPNFFAVRKYMRARAHGPSC